MLFGPGVQREDLINRLRRRMHGPQYLPKRACGPNCRYDWQSMDPSQWIASFRITHENARRGSLSEPDYKKYLGMRDELARSLMNSQGLTAPEGVPPRRAFKLAHVFQIELGGVCKTITREISCSAFTAIVTGTFKEGERVSFSLL